MPSDHTVCVVLTEDLVRQLREVAEEETIPISAVVRQALKAYFFARTANTPSAATGHVRKQLKLVP